MKKTNVGKWLWMMNYCKENRLSPANTFFWKEAEIAYQEHLDSKFDYTLHSQKKAQSEVDLILNVSSEDPSYKNYFKI